MTSIKKEVTLFLIPFAGGNKYSFNCFKNLFAKNIIFSPLELPGRGMRIHEPLKFNIDDLVSDLYLQVKEQLDKPYAFYGHSMGSIVVYLLTKKIMSEGHAHPVHLFLSGRAGPSSTDKTQRYLLPKSEFRNELLQLGGMTDDMINDEALMDFFEPILRADFQVIETYQYKFSPPMNIPFTVFMGTSDRASLEEVGFWQKETIMPITLHQFSGGHFFIYDYSKLIADIVSQAL